MKEDKNIPISQESKETDVRDPERREALKRAGTLAIAASIAPAMITLLKATKASAQSGNPQGNGGT